MIAWSNKCLCIAFFHKYWCSVYGHCFLWGFLGSDECSGAAVFTSGVPAGAFLIFFLVPLWLFHFILTFKSICLSVVWPSSLDLFPLVSFLLFWPHTKKVTISIEKNAYRSNIYLFHNHGTMKYVTSPQTWICVSRPANNTNSAAGFFSFSWEAPQWNQMVSEQTCNHFKVLVPFHFQSLTTTVHVMKKKKQNTK